MQHDRPQPFRLQQKHQGGTAPFQMQDFFHHRRRQAGHPDDAITDTDYGTLLADPQAQVIIVGNGENR